MNKVPNKKQGFELQSMLMPLAVSTGLVVLVVNVLLGLQLQSDPTVHALIESLMQLALLFIMGLALQTARRERDSYILLMFFAFTGTFLLDLRHLLYSVEPYAPVFGITLVNLETNQYSSAQSWLAPRLYFAAMLLASTLHQLLEARRGYISIKRALPAQVLLAFTLGVGAYLTSNWITRPFPGVSFVSPLQPGETLAGVLSLFALVGYVYLGRWKESVFEVFLACAIVINVITHCFVMPFSQQDYDSYYATAHFLKFVSYIVLLAGLVSRSREKTRALLAEERKRSQSILEIVADGIFTLDSTGTITNINPGGCAILEESVESLQDQNIRRWVPELEVEDNFLTQGREYSVAGNAMELDAVLANGSHKPLEISFNVAHHDDDEKVFVGVMRDISDRKQREVELQNLTLKLETALAAAGLGSWEWDAKNGVATWDEQSQLLHGLPQGRGKYEISREQVMALVHPEDRVEVEGHFDNTDEEKRYRDREYRIRRKSDGVERWINTSGAMLFDNKGNLIRVVGVMSDVTERKENIAQLTAAREEAREASRVKSAFLANMSHEIRTPMNGVIGMLDVLQQSSLNSRQMEMTHLIKESSLSLLNIIDDILDFSKIEAGKLAIVAEPMSLESLVEGVGGSLDLLAREAGVELSLFCDPTLPGTVSGDAHRLRQVLVNLVNNAIKFSAGQDYPGRVALRATLTAVQEDTASLEFTVIDNGIGMDAEIQSAVFESFVQADASTQRRFGGTGLGLAITQSLVTIMDGSLEVESKPGAGSVFRVKLSLPIIKQNNAVPAADIRLDNLPCLLIDDPSGWTEDLAIYLSLAGARVQRVARISQLADWPGWEAHGSALCIIDRGDQSFSAGDLERLRSGEAHIVHVQRDRRQRIVPFEAGSLIDGNALGRTAFLRQIKQSVDPSGSGYEGDTDQALPLPETTLPSREEAIANRQLILVAEDNSINQTVIREQLTTLGYTADMADDGEEALARWREGTYSLILTDLQMPVLDGYELAARIRAEEGPGERLPIIALSASAMQGEADRCSAAGMDEFLSKPARLKDLEAALKKWLPTSKREAEKSANSSTIAAANDPLPINLFVLQDLVGGGSAMIPSLLEDYRESMTEIRDKLLDAWSEGRLDEVSSLAHQLKSSSRTIGAVTLGELCEQVEVAGKAYNASALGEFIPRLEAEIIAVESFITRNALPAA